MKAKKTYLDGLRRAHEVAMGCLPWPGCGKKEKLLAIGNIMGIPIRAIEDEIEKTEGGMLS
jgi:hypothetical protein